MKKLFIILSLGLLALTGCNDKENPQPPLVTNPTLPPATEDFAPGETITVTGSGFTASDQIWFRTPTKAAVQDIQATIVHQTPTGITFMTPEGLPAGENTIILKRSDAEMTLGKITVAEISAKLYGFGTVDRETTGILWEIDKTTGEPTEIVLLPTEENNGWGSPVVDPVNDLIFFYKWYGDDDSRRQAELYRADSKSKTLNKIGSLKDNKEKNFYHLCMIKRQLHAVIETRNNDNEVFYSLVAIDPNTAAQTTVIDPQSLNKALGVPNSAEIGMEGDDVLPVYDPISKGLLVPVWNGERYQLIKMDLAAKKIVSGGIVGNGGDLNLFPMNGKICGTEYSRDYMGVDFRMIDAATLTAGTSIGNVTLAGDDGFSFESPWYYDAATNSSYSVIWKNLESENAQTILCVYDFQAKAFKKIKTYTEGLSLWMVFN